LKVLFFFLFFKVNPVVTPIFFQLWATISLRFRGRFPPFSSFSCVPLHRFPPLFFHFALANAFPTVFCRLPGFVAPVSLIEHGTGAPPKKTKSCDYRGLAFFFPPFSSSPAQASVDAPHPTFQGHTSSTVHPDLPLSQSCLLPFPGRFPVNFFFSISSNRGSPTAESLPTYFLFLFSFSSFLVSCASCQLGIRYLGWMESVVRCAAVLFYDPPLVTSPFPRLFDLHFFSPLSV